MLSEGRLYNGLGSSSVVSSVLTAQDPVLRSFVTLELTQSSSRRGHMNLNSSDPPTATFNLTPTSGKVPDGTDVD
eukprot:860584-Pyramimonas_sp.AAC.1